MFNGVLMIINVVDTLPMPKVINFGIHHAFHITV